MFCFADAYDYQELYFILKDSLRQEEFNGIIDEINAEYNFEAKKDLLLEVEENKRLKDQRTFWMFLLGGGVIKHFRFRKHN